MGTHASYPKVVHFGNDPIEATNETLFCPIIDTCSNARVRLVYCQIAATDIDFPEAAKATDILGLTQSTCFWVLSTRRWSSNVPLRLGCNFISGL